MIKTSAVKPEHLIVTAPAAVFDGQEEFLAAFQRGELYRDVVAVVRFQGPRANGMPELHSLTPALGVIQDRGFQTALVTDGRMSGASGKVPAAIHLTPEALDGGLISKLEHGDVIRVDAVAGTLEVLVPEAELRARPSTAPPTSPPGFGRELFANLRRAVGPADRGASIF